MRKIFEYENDDMNITTNNTTYNEEEKAMTREMREITKEYKNKGIQIGDCNIYALNNGRRIIEYGECMMIGMDAERLDRICELARRQRKTLEDILDNDDEDIDEAINKMEWEKHCREMKKMAIDIFADDYPEEARIMRHIPAEQFQYIDAFDWEHDGIWFDHDRYQIDLWRAARIITNPIITEYHGDIANALWDTAVADPFQNPFDYERVKDNIR